MNSLRLALLAIVFAVAAVAGWQMAGSPVFWPSLAGPPQVVALVPAGLPPPVAPPAVPTLENIRALVEARIAAAPAYAAYFARLREAFPAEYPGILDAMAQPAFASAAKGAGSGSVDEDIALAMRRLRQTHGILAARADLATLDRLPLAQLAIMRQLAAGDQKLCVDYFYGGGTRDFYGFSALNRVLVANLATASLDAIAQGRDRKETPPEPGDADIQTFDDALASSGLGRAEIDVLLEGKSSGAPLDDASLCHAGLVYLQVALSLPGSIRLPLLSRSVALAARS